MKNSGRNDRAQLRQQIVNHWFDRFVEEELYDTDQYHQFCNRVKGKTELEIERIFRLEKWITK